MWLWLTFAIATPLIPIAVVAATDEGVSVG